MTDRSGLGQVTPGFGSTKTFNELSFNVDNFSIEGAGAIAILRIKNTGLGTGLTGGSGEIIQTTSDQSHVTKLGTIDTGTWAANTVQVC